MLQLQDVGTAAQAAQQVVAQVGFLGLRLEGWLTIAAILSGPIIALELQRKIERDREHERRKVRLFKELMATRATRLTPRHVEALNSIETDFSDAKGGDKRVRDAWRIYLDHLGKPAADDDQPGIDRWMEKGNDLINDLLFAMSECLHFGFDKVTLKNNVYYPRAHGQLETDQELLRKFVLELMEGKRVLWTGIVTGDKPVQMELVTPTKPPAAPPAPQPAVATV